MQSRFAMPIVAVLALLLSVGTLLGASVSTVRAQDDFAPDHAFADPAFEDRWERTDQPVADDVVDRTWIWGPGPFTDGMMEEYADSPGGERLVQYFDKSRMEINDPNAFNDGLWYVTNGLLVIEMVEGKYQTGDAEFDESPEPAEVNIVGDPADASGSVPTYADIHTYGLQDTSATPVGATITLVIDANGNVTTDNAYAGYGVTASERVTVTGIDHTVASVFWEFMTSSGIVWMNGEYVTEDLFRNPFYATGYPITEAYWTTAPVGGTERDVLWQCFERRCLTYTPGNPDGFLVEAGNVGQHYYRWRYGDNGGATETVDLFLVSTGTGDVGCGDSLVAIQEEIESHDSTEARITAALEALFDLSPSDYEGEGLYNALQNSNLSASDVTIDSGTATVMLSGDLSVGGVCDEPRVEEQIRQTVLQFDGVNDVVIRLNGEPLFEQQTTTVDLYLVSTGTGDVGCGDSLVAIQGEVQASGSTAARISAALEALFDLSEDDYDDTDLYNALENSNLNVDDVMLDNGTATVMLSGELNIGGVCDEPRVEEQIRQTALQFEGVTEVVIYLNGEELFGPPTESADMFLVAIGDAGENGELIGCDDSLIPVEISIPQSGDVAAKIEAALSELLAIDTEQYGQSGLYSALYRSDLTVESVTVVNGEVTVRLTGDFMVGGVCDDPRVEAQLRVTVTQFDGVSTATFILNGEAMFPDSQ